MIRRKRHQDRILGLLKSFPVVAILGARQVGKPTLAQQIVKTYRGRGERLDLEDPADLARLHDARLTHSVMRGLKVLDEILRRPDLFPVLRVLADRRSKTRPFSRVGERFA